MKPRLTWILPSLVLGCATMQAQPLPTVFWRVATTNLGVRESAITADGQFLAVGGSGPIQIRRTSNGALKQTLPGHPEILHGLDFSEDGLSLASIARDEKAKVWSVQNGSESLVISNVLVKNWGFNATIAFSPDGSRLVTPVATSSTNLVIWRLDENGEAHLEHELAAHRGGINAVDFSPDGQWLASGGSFRGQDTTVKIWDPKTGALLKTLQTSNTYGIDDLTFSRDGSMLATGTDHLPNFEGNIELWNTSDWSLKLRLRGKGYLVEFTPDGKFLVSVFANHLELWRVADGTFVRGYSLPGTEFGFVSTMNFLPEGDALILGGVVMGQSHGFIHALRSPARGVDLVRKPGAVGFELSWVEEDATLQQRNNFSSPWENAEVTGPGAAKFLPQGTSGFFRLKPQ